MTKKEIETYLLLHEQKIETFVKSRSQNWLIAAGVAFVLFIVLVVVIFRNKPINEAYENQIKTLDSLVHYQQSTINALQRVNAGQDSVIHNLDEAYKKNRPVETRIIKEHDKIPTDVRNLDKLNLRREVATFPE